MKNETVIAITSITMAVLIGAAAIAWGSPIALAVLLIGIAAEWLRYSIAEIGLDWPGLWLVPLIAYPLAAAIALAS